MLPSSKDQKTIHKIILCRNIEYPGRTRGERKWRRSWKISLYQSERREGFYIRLDSDLLWFYSSDAKRRGTTISMDANRRCYWEERQFLGMLDYTTYNRDRNIYCESRCLISWKFRHVVFVVPILLGFKYIVLVEWCQLFYLWIKRFKSIISITLILVQIHVGLYISTLIWKETFMDWYLVCANTSLSEMSGHKILVLDSFHAE